MISYNETSFGTLIKRPSKKIKSPYVGDIQVEDQECLGHCPSLGLGNILKCDSELLLSKSKNKNSKTDYVIEAVKEDNIWIGNVPLHANRLVKQLLEQNVLIENTSYIKPEYSMGDSRIDFYVKDSDNKEHFIEVKSVHIKDGGSAIFPVGYKKKKDATVSERANKHVKHMTELASCGKNAYIIFVVQREDCVTFEPNRKTDPIFTELLQKAYETGVHIKALQCSVSTESLQFLKEIPCII